MHWALIAECLTCLKPFLQTWHGGVPPESEQSQYWGALSNMMSSSNGAGKSRDHGSSRRQETTDDRGNDGELKPRADLPAFSTKIASDRKGVWGPEAEDGIELLPSKIRVRTTTTTIKS